MHLGVLSVGRTGPELIEEVIRHLSEFFSFEVSYAGMIELPDNAYNPKRHQYFSPTIIKICKQEALKLGFDKVLGITSADIYAARATYIFGQAELLGKVALVSYFRLRDDDQKIFMERLLKESIHEIGHTLGLRHCRNFECVMYFSRDISDTDKKTFKFCSKCRAKLDGHLR